MPVKRIVMILGFQRSGTTALFETLASAPGVSPRHEHANDDLYDDFFLRPEPQIRPVLAVLPGTVLFKPVRESRRRSPLEVAEEYRDYDLTMIWLYRDPVNVYQSWLEKQWVTNPEGIGQHWVSRNKKCLASQAALGDTLLIVRYEDLVTSAASVAAPRPTLPRAAAAPPPAPAPPRRRHTANGSPRWPLREPWRCGLRVRL